MSTHQDSRELIRRCYAAFNARDLDGAVAGMRPDVDWPNAIDGRRLIGVPAVREYWARQFSAIDPRVEPLGFSEDEHGRLVVDVHQVVRNLEGDVLAEDRIEHVYELRSGLIERMDVRG